MDGDLYLLREGALTDNGYPYHLCPPPLLLHCFPEEAARVAKAA